MRRLGGVAPALGIRPLVALGERWKGGDRKPNRRGVEMGALVVVGVAVEVVGNTGLPAGIRASGCFFRLGRFLMTLVGTFFTGVDDEPSNP